MGAKKKDWSDYAEDVRQEMEEKGKRGAKKTAKKSVKKMHAATKVIAVVALLVGIAAGALVCMVLFKNDRFVLKGSTQFSLDAGTPYVYVEEGVEAVCFGRDVSNALDVVYSKEITKDADGNYVIPAEAGVYTITYTVDCYKFGEDGPNGQIKRIRTFVVNEAEEDGRNG